MEEPGSRLIFPGLTENQAGKYTCHAFYSNTVPLNASVEIETYGMYDIYLKKVL